MTAKELKALKSAIESSGKVNVIRLKGMSGGITLECLQWLLNNNVEATKDVWQYIFEECLKDMSYTTFGVNKLNKGE